MNGVDYAQKLNRQREIFQKNLNDANRNHKEEVDHLKETHENVNQSRVTAHKNSLEKLEKGYQTNIEKMRDSQAESLMNKSREYELARQKNVEDFHKERTENAKEFNRQFSNLRKDFDRNIDQTKQSYKERADQADINYENRVSDVRKNARNDLDDYIKTVEQRKDEQNNQNVAEKEVMRQQFELDKNAILKREQEKRNFILENAATDTQTNKRLQEQNYIDSKTMAQNRFNKMLNDQDAKIEKVVTEREDVWNRNLQQSELARNREFSKRYEELSTLYDKNIRDIQLKGRAEKLTRGERSKELEKQYRESLANQFQNQKETLLDERKKMVKEYDKRIENTIDAYQENIRKDNITHAGQMSELEGRLVEEARRDKFSSDLDKERIIHENNTRLKYVEDKNEDRRVQTKILNQRKITNLKKDFADSMEKARKASMKNFEKAKNEMIREKREIAKRLHEQNSKQSAYLKESHSDNMEKMRRSYEKRIADLELQNKLIAQNSNVQIQDIMRKTALEIDRQREVAIRSAESEVRTERAISKEKEHALQERIDKMQAVFNEKINEQTIASRKKIKDLHFELSNKLVTESKRYQEVIDQNNKFFARELQRLQMASTSERERLVTQYEDRIAQLKKAYSSRIEDMKSTVRVTNA